MIDRGSLLTILQSGEPDGEGNIRATVPFEWQPWFQEAEVRNQLAIWRDELLAVCKEYPFAAATFDALLGIRQTETVRRKLVLAHTRQELRSLYEDMNGSDLIPGDTVDVLTRWAERPLLSENVAEKITRARDDAGVGDIPATCASLLAAVRECDREASRHVISNAGSDADAGPTCSSSRSTSSLPPVPPGETENC